MQLKMTLDQHCYFNELYRFDPKDSLIRALSGALKGFTVQGFYFSRGKKKHDQVFIFLSFFCLSVKTMYIIIPLKICLDEV